jgi:hypothetical protein
LMAALATLLAAASLGLRQTLVRLEQQDATPQVSAIAEHIRQDFDGILAIPRIAADTPDPFIFKGNTTKVEFITRHAPLGQVAGLYEVELLLGQSGQSGTFDVMETRRLHRRNNPTDQSPPRRPETTSVLLRSISSPLFRFFGAKEHGSPIVWHDTWIHGTRLPQLVSLDYLAASSAQAQPVAPSRFLFSVHEN